MQHEFFAASNSAHGFKNYFPEIFSRVERLYVIKGGPGTGKSSFMRKCALYGENEGFEVEKYLCSSDSTSLDGVILNDGERTVGIIDGTYPHLWEPKHPGAVEQIINLGEFWDEKLLADQKNEIISLGAKKSAAYNKAYGYLRSCGNIRAVTDPILHSVIDLDKMKKAVARLSRQHDQNKSGEIYRLPAIIDGITMSGQMRLDSFEKNADKIYWIDRFYGAGQLFLCELAERLKERELALRIAYDAICPWLVNGIFVENDRVTYILSNGEKENENFGKEEKYINVKRFVYQEKLAENRAELRYNEKLTQSALDSALRSLSEVKIYHFLLEDIYKNAMDFELLGEYTEDFIYRI